MGKTVLGLEVKKHLIKAAVLKSVSDEDIQILHLIDAEIADHEPADVLKQVMEQIGPVDSVVTAVNDRNTILKRISGARSIRTKLRRELIEEVRTDYLSYGLEPKYYDFFDIRKYTKMLKTGEKIDHLTLGLKVVKDNSEVDHLINLFKEAGILNLLESIETDSISLFNLYCYVTEGIEITENIALIDVSRDRILIVITDRDKSFHSSRVIPVIDNNIGEAINSLNNTFVIPDIIREIGSIKRVLLSGTPETVDYVRSQLVWISSLYENLTFAVEKEILEKFNSEDDFEVRGINLNLAEKFDSQIGLSEVDRFAVPIALALKGVTEVKIGFDLLGSKNEEKKQSALFNSVLILLCLLSTITCMYMYLVLLPAETRMNAAREKEVQEIGIKADELDIKLREWAQTSKWIPEVDTEDAESKPGSGTLFLSQTSALSVLTAVQDKNLGMVRQLNVEKSSLNIETETGLKYSLRLTPHDR